MRWATIGTAIAVAGVLDIGAAMLLTLSRGKSIVGMLQGVASGPFGGWPSESGLIGAAAGLGVHFGLMALMVVFFAVIASRTDILARPVVIVGPAYGLFLYLVMYWLVLPTRWPTVHPQSGLTEILIPLSIHIIFVGLPIALIFARSVRGSGTPSNGTARAAV